MTQYAVFMTVAGLPPDGVVFGWPNVNVQYMAVDDTDTYADSGYGVSVPIHFADAKHPDLRAFRKRAEDEVTTLMAANISGLNPDTLNFYWI